MRNLANRTLGDRKVSAALFGVLSEMACESYRLAVLGDDPSNRTAASHHAFQLVEAHPAFPSARVNPLDEYEIAVTGHVCEPQNASVPEVQKQQRFGRHDDDSCASISTRYSLPALMCAHRTYKTPRGSHCPAGPIEEQPRCQTVWLNHESAWLLKLGHYRPPGFVDPRADFP